MWILAYPFMNILFFEWLIKFIFFQQSSPMRNPSLLFLSLRALGAPAVVIALAVQGVFRGFKDTKTPLLCVGKFST